VKKIVECVPNFSEGRRKEVVDELISALTSPPGVALLDSEMDAAHNRCVITIAGEPQAVAEGVTRGVGRAAELIDLRKHEGEHPRMGATDVIPFIPITGMSMQECVELSIQVAERIARVCEIPVYLYEQSARIPARQDLAYIRKGEFEGIREEIQSNPDRKPDFGPSALHPSAGATAVGARFPLIAYNIYLNTPDLKIAQAIARAVRYSSGGLRYVKALGFEIKARNQVQVSMNLTNFESTPIFRAFEMVSREAERHGVTVASSEIVGLVPQSALNSCADHYLRLENFSEKQILENRLADAISASPTMEEFLSRVAAPEAVPGGGSVAALAGSLAAALGEMVAGFTLGKPKYSAVESRVRELSNDLSMARNLLQALVTKDSQAYLEVVRAMKLPKNSDQEKTARAKAIESATQLATAIPLETARVAAKVLECLEELIRIGNTNTRSDAAAGSQLAYAALKSAQYNVLINAPGLSDRDYAERCRSEAADLACRGSSLLGKIDTLMTA
jgi:glutamate formiminotransferase/formiminotetrahydrofolate cyclodeaminase